MTWLLANWKLVAIGVLLALLGLKTVRIAELKQSAAALQLSLANQAKEAESRERQKEREWTDKVTEVSRNAEAEKNALEVDLAASRDAADRLRTAATSVARRACPTATTTGSGEGQPSPDPLDLLAQLLDRHSQELIVVGKYADQLRVAGVACERAADALK